MFPDPDEVACEAEAQEWAYQKLTAMAEKEN